MSDLNPQDYIEHTADELEEMPTLSEGQADDCKIDNGDGTRVWLSRVGIGDGARYERAVTVERRDERGRWFDWIIYDGDNPSDFVVGDSWEEPAQ